MENVLKNVWYMAAWSDEVAAGPFGTKMLGKAIVIYRGEDGRLVAMDGMCPHRFAPLAKGSIHRDLIACPYHGLRFGPDGQCAHSPFGLATPPEAKLTVYPVSEQHDAIWVWFGDPAAADPSLVPDFAYHTDPQYRTVRGRSHIRSNYELVTDNLMDLTHTRFLHPIFGGEDWVPDVHFSQDGDMVFSHYDLRPYPPSPFSDAIMGASHGRQVAERDFIRWQAPASMYLDIRFSWADTPGSEEYPQPSSHILTPETDGTTHYFWASAVLRDAAMTDADHLEGLRHAFDIEDGVMLEDVQTMMEGRDFWDMRPAILAYDQGGIRARRILRKLIRAEQGVETTEALDAA